MIICAGSAGAFTVTLKAPIPTFPAGSVAKHLTCVVPTGNKNPDGGRQLATMPGPEASVTVTVNDTTAPFDEVAVTVIGAGIVSLGASRSILLPGIGPTCVQFPTVSQTLRLFVSAFSFGVPTGTEVASRKLASSAFARPEPPSATVQGHVTLSGCQATSGVAHVPTGAFRSTLKPVIGP